MRTSSKVILKFKKEVLTLSILIATENLSLIVFTSHPAIVVCTIPIDPIAVKTTKTIAIVLAILNPIDLSFLIVLYVLPLYFKIEL
jgi:hypothetical protein